MPKNLSLPKLKPRQTSGLIVRIPRTKTAAMMLLREHAVRGYWFWTRGRVSIDKAVALAQKFDALYHTGATPAQRTWRKKKARANAHLVMYPDDDGEHILWWLQVTLYDEHDLVSQRERLHDARQRRQWLEWTHQYYLAYRQRSRAKGGKAGWSWWMQAPYHATWETAVLTGAARHGRLTANGVPLETLERTDDLCGSVQSLMRMPLFGGIRSQVLGLLDATQRVWTRAHYHPLPFPWPAELPWLGQRLPLYDDPPLTLEVLVRVMQRRRADAGRCATVLDAPDDAWPAVGDDDADGSASA